jgi:hypothetical protein
MTTEGILMLTLLGIGLVLGVMFSVIAFFYIFTGRSGAKARKWLSEI